MRGDNVKDDDGNQSPKKGRISFASGSSQFHNTNVRTSQQCRANKKREVLMNETPRLLNMSEKEYPQVRTRLPPNRGQRSWDCIQDSVVPRTPWVAR